MGRTQTSIHRPCPLYHLVDATGTQHCSGLYQFLPDHRQDTWIQHYDYAIAFSTALHICRNPERVQLLPQRPCERTLATRGLATGVQQHRVHHQRRDPERGSSVYLNLHDDVDLRLLRMYSLLGLDIASASAFETCRGLCRRERWV